MKKGSTAAKNPADLTYGQEAAMRQRKEQAMIAKARRTSDAEAKERADKTGRPEYVTGVSELREQQLKEKLETEKNLKSRKGSNLEQLGDNIVYEDPRKTIPAQELKSRIASLKRKLVLRKSLLQSVEENRRAAAKAYKELPEQLSNASAFLSAKKEQVRTISKRLSRIRQNYTGDSTEYTEMKEAMDALISLDENSSVEQVSGAFSRLQQKARNYLSEKRGFLRYRALFHKRAGKECMAAAEDLVGLCDGAAEQFQQKKDNDASHEVQAEYQYFRRQLKNFAEMKIVPAVPSLEKTSARKPARAQAVKDMYHKLMQACRGLECDDPATRSILDRFDADRRNKVYQDIANAGLNDDDRLGQSIAAMETEINQQVYNEKTVLYNREGKRTGQIGNRDLGSIRNRLVSKAAVMDDPQIPVEENGVQGMKTLKVGVRSMEELQRQFGQHYDENVERSDHFKYAQFKGRQFSHPLPRDMREEGSSEDIRQQMNEVRQEQMNDRSKSKESGELSNRPTLP